MTEQVGAPDSGAVADPRLPFDGVAIFGQINAVRSGLGRLGREYRDLSASVLEIRHNMSGMRTEFDDASNDIGRIFDAVESLDARTGRLEAQIEANTRMLERLLRRCG